MQAIPDSGRNLPLAVDRIKVIAVLNDGLCAQIDLLELKIRADFVQHDMGAEGTGSWGVVKFHANSPCRWIQWIARKCRMAENRHPARPHNKAAATYSRLCAKGR